MKVIKYENAIQRNDLEGLLQNFISIEVEEDTLFAIKISPLDKPSSFLNFFYTEVDDSYSFTGLRGLFLFKSKLSFEAEKFIPLFCSFGDYSIEKYPGIVDESYVRIFIDGLPAFVFKKYLVNSYFCYEIYFPGSPAKPILKGKEHCLYPLTMIWPIYQECCSFDKDSILTAALEKLSLLFEDFTVYSVKNIKDAAFCYPNDPDAFVQSLKTFNEPYALFSPEIYTIEIKKDSILNICYDLKNNFHYFTEDCQKSEDFVRQIKAFSGDLYRFLYVDTSSINSPDNCHLFAKELQQGLPEQLSGTSYYQLAFDSDLFDLNTTLAYGHNTPKEKNAVGKAQVYFYKQGRPIRIGIYKKNLCLITVDHAIDNKVDYLNYITSFILEKFTAA